MTDPRLFDLPAWVGRMCVRLNREHFDGALVVHCIARIDGLTATTAVNGSRFITLDSADVRRGRTEVRRSLLHEMAHIAAQATPEGAALEARFSFARSNGLAHSPAFAKQANRLARRLGWPRVRSDGLDGAYWPDPIPAELRAGLGLKGRSKGAVKR